MRGSHTVALATGGVLIVLIIGIAIPKLTVHDSVALTSAEKDCAYGIFTHIAEESLFHRIALALGKGAIIEKRGPTDFGGKAYTIFRIPIPGAYGIDCLLAAPPVVPVENPVLSVSTAEVPEGWYSHVVAGLDGFEIILTKTPELPKIDPSNYAYGEHIAVVERDIGLTPEQYVERNVSVSGPTVQYATWSALYGRKMLSIGFTDPNDNSKQQSTYLFSGSHFVLINLYPDKQENRAAFQQVVNYYAQDASVPVIPRTETLTACKTVNLPPGEEYTISADSETAYVAVGYHENGSAQHVFFNYNDDLSQCTPSVKDLLERTKGHGDAMTP